MARAPAQDATGAEHTSSEPDRPPPAGGPAKGPDEEAIVGALSRGEHRQALALCARHYGPSIGRLCMALVGSQAEADDLTQETLLAAHAAFPSWRQEGSLRAWLLGIARRRCAGYLERRSRQSRRLHLVGEPAGEASAEQHLLLQRRARAARSALDALRPSEREVVLLRYGAELSFRHVAEAFGIDEAAARKRASRALAELRLRLEGET